MIAVFGARADTVINASDTLSRGKAGALANHAIAFIAPGGIPEGATMTIAFPAAFNAVGMTEDEVDLFDNGLPVTTAPDCSGAEQASAVWIGKTLSFQVCPGDGGAFGPGNTVAVNIGTTAVDSGVGVDRLVNPAATGSYRVAIGGSFGDSGFAPVAISADDEINVTACVGAICNVVPPTPLAPPMPVTGGSTGPEQTPPPQISGLAIDRITASTARVSWHTDILSDSHVLYGLNGDYGAVRGDNSRTQDHVITLMGLGSGLTYHLAARSIGFFGDVGLSKDTTFTTLPVKSSVLPRIRDIRLLSVGGSEALVTWKTSVSTYWRVEYGRTVNYGNAVENGQFDPSHSVALGNLTPNAVYHFRIIAIDENGNQAISPDQSFSTFDTTPPAIANIRVEYVSPISVDITWNTSKAATGGVQYGQSTSYEKGEVLETIGFATAHRASLTQLEPGSAYHYKIFQTDRSGNDAQSDDKVFLIPSLPAAPTVLENIPLPPIPKNAIAVGSEKFLLTVNNVSAAIVANEAAVTPGSLVGLGLSGEMTAKAIDRALILVGNRAYKPNNLFWTYFRSPSTPGDVPITATINYKDGSSAYAKWSLKIVTAGTVYEIVDRQNIPVSGALVTLMENGAPWDGSQYGQNSTQNTGDHGNYSFFVPNGKYSLKIEKKGYQTSNTSEKIYSGLLNDQLQISKHALFASISINFGKYLTNKLVYVLTISIVLLSIGYIIRRYIKRNKRH